MKSITDRVAYLKGLAEGLKVDNASDEGKLIGQIIEVLGDITGKLDELNEAYDELSDYVECIDDDLEALEMADDEDMDEDDFDDDDVFADEDDEDDDEDDDEEESDEYGEIFDDDEIDDEDEDDDEDNGMYAGCLCSDCGGMFSVDVHNDLEQLYICPHCGKKVRAVPMSCKNVPIAQELDEDEE